jgi:sialate O-acetylesterase
VPVRIWGSAEAGETVRVAFQGQSVDTRAGADGKWTAWLKPLVAGGPLTMTIAGANTITIQDVLVGEVWVGSGQSNMNWTVARSNDAEREIGAAHYPMMRLFQVKLTVADQPAADVEGAWRICTPDAIRNFSAVEYFFGREIHQRRHVPMGLIQSAWGGTPAQSWISRPALEGDPALQYVLEEWDRVLAHYPAARERYEKLSAEWKRGVRESKQPPRPPAGPGHQNTPGGLYNAMIAPLTPFAIRGAIWYQGESNANEAHAFRYRRLFRAMIEDWRRAWGQWDFPFLYVQLANFRANPYWPVLRESQTDALQLRNTAMALAIDIGDPDDIHPTNKQEVGRRLALAARGMVYGEPVEFSGPLFRTATREGAAMRVWFDHAEGLQARGGAEPAGFGIAGSDGNFVPAEARVEGGSVLVSSPQAPEPAAVRYAWADDPEANLVNRAGLPAVPFRSDQPR